MSLSEILSSALSGLNATQAAMRTVSNNIANVNTAGYAREKVSLTTGVTAGRVSGVVVGEPSRVADKYLETTVYARSGDAGRAEVVSTYLDRLQSVLGASDSDSGISARLNAVASAATAMTGSAGGPQTSAAFVGSVADAVGTIQQLGTDVSAIRSDVEGEVGYSVDRANTLLRNIYDLNDSVARLEGLGRSSAGVADQRTSAIQELSGLIGVNAREQSDGRVTIETTTGVQLVDRRLRQLSYADSGAGSSQPIYAPIEVRFAAADGSPGATTGEKIDSPSIGGKLGGLLDLRDHQLPGFSDQVADVFAGMAQVLNTASNAGTAVPPPATLEGRATALTGSDRLGFTGAATFAVTKSDGTLVVKTKIDFSALGANATVDDAVAAINAGLGSAGTASFVSGKLTIAASASGNGAAIGQDATSPSARAGIGFSQYFGLNDIVRSDTAMLAPSGFKSGDAHGFAAGQSADLALRDTSGRVLARYTLGATGSTFGDLVTNLNASPLAGYGSFAMDDAGRIRFSPTASNAGAALSVVSDTTDRAGTGRSLSEITGLGGATASLAGAEVRRDIVADPSRLPLARLQDVAVGAKALGAGDRRGASGFADATEAVVDLGRNGMTSVSRLTASVLGNAATAASRAQTMQTTTTTRRDDAVASRDNFSGVSIDEELGQMVVLQNSYSAAARVMSTASAMYDTLLAMVR
ncbi:flagellar hook-associated protein FlgK [Sphingomonas sp. Leaf242]|uniref:flagellar hook-associated protein FlgK n=1 Tax=Sphingomonas sp. Leaf242 TaxID=1736304 RepID=UPI00071287BB|nr:flagellar hook-associated protein FlgK [Sphingomonas sp. Leaf242]KQO05262.1 flagellar biosynthesis protein FlgK [Sphingomonas sp. Leaf242]